MGKVSSDHSPSEIPASSTILHHFSHPHPLQLLKFQPQQTLTLTPPSCCKNKPSEWMYACLTCNYFLHEKCSQLPQKITHQSHHHNLNLILSPPYQNKSFCCDICKNVGLNHWLYRCDSCGFDAHLNCANAAVQQTHGAQNGVDFGSPDFMRNFHDNVCANILATSANARTRQENMLASQMFQQVGNNVNADHLLLQRIMAGGAGGVGGGSQLQALMGGGNQLQALLGGGGGNPVQALMGGGGNPLQALMGGAGAGANPLQALMGGGGAGGNPLQALMGGGGGGVADIMQSLIGGGGGGGDLLQGLIGGLGGF